MISPPHKYSFRLILQSERGEKEDAKKKKNGRGWRVLRKLAEHSVKIRWC